MTDLPPDASAGAGAPDPNPDVTDIEGGADVALELDDRSPDAPATDDGEPTNVVVRAYRALVVPVLALVTALIVGGLVMIFTDPDTLGYWNAFGADPGSAFRESWLTVADAYAALFRGSFGSVNAISETLLYATPLLLAGLAVGFAFKAGLFNIGGSGQLLMGTICASWVGFHFSLPTPVHLTLALAAGVAAGAVWGGIAGFLKARTGAHEVITTIMLNYIALLLVDYLLSTQAFLRPGRRDPITPPVKGTAELPLLFGDDHRVNAGLFLAIGAAVLVWWVLYRSTLGFRLRAVGSNATAATYAGMSVTSTWLVAMLGAGGLAGLAGAIQVLGVDRSVTGGLPTIGFDAIALALLGRSHPAGIAAAAVLFGALQAGATEMQAATGTPIDIVVVVQALIIVFIAAPALIRAIWRVKADKYTTAQTLGTSWGA